MDNLAFNIIISLIVSAVRSSCPLILTALGLIHIARSGIYYLGIEGSLMLGALASFFVLNQTSSFLLAVFAGMLLGGLLTLIHGLLTVSIGLNNAVVGVMLGTIGVALADFFGRPILTRQIVNLQALDMGFLSRLPVIGPILFNQNILVYITILLMLLSYFIFKFTRLGSRIIAVGDNPQAADAVGIKVNRVRYLSLFYGGLLIGLGGAYLSLNYSTTFVPGISSGRGWIAFALMIFGRYNPLFVGFGGLLFGSMEALEFRLGIFDIEVPVYILKMLPYIATIIVLFISTFSTRRHYPPEPQSEDIAYRRE